MFYFEPNFIEKKILWKKWFFSVPWLFSRNDYSFLVNIFKQNILKCFLIYLWLLKVYTTVEVTA